MHLHLSAMVLLFLMVFCRDGFPGQLLNGLRPSDPSRFTNVINIPPSRIGGDACTGPNVALPECAVIGGVTGETTQLNLFEGGEINDPFEADFGTEINIGGGNVRQFFNMKNGSEVNISGGHVSGINLMSDNIVNISGGRVSSVHAMSGSIVNVSDGYVDLLSAVDSVVNVNGGNVPVVFDVRSDSTVNISSGNFLGGMAVLGSEANIAGGDFGSAIHLEEAGTEANISGGNFDEFNALVLAFADTEVNLFGTQFLLDGAKVDLQVGESLTIAERNVSLAGLFADGTEFQFQLSDRLPAVEFDYFSTEATLTVTLVPEPNGCGMLLTGTLVVGHFLRRMRLRGSVEE